MGAKCPLPERVPIPNPHEKLRLEALGIVFGSLPGEPVEKDRHERLFITATLPPQLEWQRTNRDDDKPDWALVDKESQMILQEIGGEWVYGAKMGWDYSTPEWPFVPRPFAPLVIPKDKSVWDNEYLTGALQGFAADERTKDLAIRAAGSLIDVVDDNKAANIAISVINALPQRRRRWKPRGQEYCVVPREKIG